MQDESTQEHNAIKIKVVNIENIVLSIHLS